MAISAPLNGAGLGELFVLNAAATADPRVLSFTPNAGDVIFAWFSNLSTQRTVSIVQTGVTWTLLYSTTNTTATYHGLEFWMGIAGAGASPNIIFNAAVNWNLVNFRVVLTQHTGFTTPNMQVCTVNAESPVTTISTPNILPVAGSDVLVMAITVALGGTISAPLTNGYVALTSGSTAHGFAYKLITGSAGVTNTTWTQVSGGAQTIIMVVSNTPPANTTVRDANVALVASVGGNAILPMVFDRRANVSDLGGVVTNWDDAINAFGGRPQAPGLFQLAAANRPTFTGTAGSGTAGVIATLAANLQHLVTGQDSRLLLSGAVADAGAIWIIACAKASADGPIFMMCPDPTALSYPFVGISPAAGNWKADFASVGAGDRVAPNSGVAWNDGVRRGTIAGKHNFRAFSNADGMYQYLMPGKTARREHLVTSPATTVAGGLKLSLGRFVAAYGTGEYDWVGVHIGRLTLAHRQAYQDFFFNNFGAAVAGNRTKTFLVYGSSIPRGTGGTDPVTPVIGSGTTSWPSLLANDAGGRGTLLVQGAIDDLEVHGYNMGIGGWNLERMKFYFQDDVAINFDRPGGKVLITDEIGNEIQKIATGSSAAAVLQLIKDITDLCHACGIKHYTCTCQDRSAGNDGSGATLFGWYSSLGGPLGVYGNVVMAVNAALIANPTTYADGVIDVEANSVFKINRAVSHASEDGTYYVIGGDYTHQVNAGYTVKESIVKAYMEANPVMFNPLSTFNNRRDIFASFRFRSRGRRGL